MKKFTMYTFYLGSIFIEEKDRLIACLARSGMVASSHGTLVTTNIQMHTTVHRIISWEMHDVDALNREVLLYT
jgi:hypothetical protein